MAGSRPLVVVRGEVRGSRQRQRRASRAGSHFCPHYLMIWGHRPSFPRAPSGAVVRLSCASAIRSAAPTSPQGP